MDHTLVNQQHCVGTKALSSMPLEAIAVVSDTVLRAACNASLLFLFFAINCQSKARRALYFGISLASPGPAQQVFEWGGGGGAKDEHVSQIGVGGGNA